MAQITIGGAPISASLSVFTRLKRAWKYIEQATKGDLDFVSGMDAIIGVIAVGLDVPIDGEPATVPGDPKSYDAQEAFRIDWIGGRLKGSEINGLRPFMNELMVDAGLTTPGE